MYDLFLSYRHADAGVVRPLVGALRERGLEVWFDEGHVEDFASIERAIEQGLAKSKALLAWYSAGYPQSLACQWELTRAFIAGEAEGDPRRRVLLVNSEPTNTHIHPIQLRDARYRAAPRDDAARSDVADAIVAHVRTLTGTLGELRGAKPRWAGAVRGVGSNRFVGRVAEMWAIHSGLWNAEFPIISAGQTRPTVRLIGIGGSGRSRRVERMRWTASGT